LDEVDDTSILKTGHPNLLSMISTLVNEPRGQAQPPLSRSDLVLWPDPADLGGAARRRLSGVHRSRCQRRREGSP
jgi:hypothetical protein